MKTYNINIDRLNSVLDTLWNHAEDAKDVSVVCHPEEKKIELFSATGLTLATINLIEVHDEYDVVSEIFN